MYASGYSQVSKPSSHTQKRMQSKGKSCGYYMRIIFFFSSLIQSLIIASLVLFLVYGKKEDSAPEDRAKDLVGRFSKLSLENATLTEQRQNLTTLLNRTLIMKARNDYDLAELRKLSNMSANIIQDYDKRLQHCTSNLYMCNASSRFPCNCGTKPLMSDNCNCGMLMERLKAHLQLVQSNFTEMMQRMRIEMDQTSKERDYINLEAIRLRRDKTTQEKELLFQKEKCKNDFFQSLSGVSNVSKAFLGKIESLFPSLQPFLISCPKQREYLEQIRTNCTNLSKEVEDKLQRYLNNVGDKVSDIQAENSRLKAENWRLSDDYRWCTQNRTGLIRERKQDLEKLQQRHDRDKEKLLMEKMKLNGEKEVLENSIQYKSRQNEYLSQQLNHLNMTCMAKTGSSGSGGSTGSSTRPSSSGGLWGSFGPSSSSSSSTAGSQSSRSASGGLGSSFSSSGSTNKIGSTGLGSSTGSSSSYGSTNKLGSTGLGSSSSSLSTPRSGSSYGSTGTGSSRLGSTGLGSSSSSLSTSGSSSSLGSSRSLFNNLASTGLGSSSSSSSSGSSSSLGSTGSLFNKPTSTGLGSSSSSSSTSGSSSSLGSTLSKYGSNGGSSSSSYGLTNSKSSLSTSGLGSNKPTSDVKSTSGQGSSSGTTGAKANPFSWFSTLSSSKKETGSATGRGTSSGSSTSGTGSTYSTGRTTVNVAEHLQNLQRLIDPAAAEQKQRERDELSRILG